MLSRTLAVCLVLFAIQSAIAEERSLLVAERVVNEKSKPAPPAKVGQAGSDTSAKVAPVTPAAQKPVPPTDSVVRVATAATTDGTPLEQMTKEVERLKAEIQQLRQGPGANPQILVHVEMLEVSRTKLRRMGTDFRAFTDRSFGADDLNSFQKGFKETASPQAYTKGEATKGNAAGGFIDWMKENRIAKSLASPSIVAVSGRPASFFNGGEIPMPNRKDSNAAVEFQKFGNELYLLAVARDKQHVRLELRAKVSEIDDSRSIEIDGVRVPSLRVRQCDTAVETAFGEPVILTGESEERTETSKTAEGVQKDVINEIVLLIIATPELITPVADAKPESAPKSLK